MESPLRGRSKRRVTMTDVAKEAGVSIATASYVLGGKRQSKVSAATQQRVLDTAVKLGYRPNRVARGLKTQRSYAIGILSSNIGFPLFGLAVAAIERVVSQQGYHVVLHNTTHHVEHERRALQFMEELQVDGSIFLSTSHVTKNAHLIEFARRIPLVTLNRYVEDDFPATAVVIDNDEAGYQAAKHLTELGRTRLAFLGTATGGPTPSYASIARLEGFRRGVIKFGIDWNTVSVHLEPKGRFDTGDGYRVMQSMLNNKAGLERPNGVYVVNDHAASGAVRAILDAGLRIPADIAVVGNDNLDVAPRICPSLTSISQRLDNAGEAAANALLCLLANDSDVPARHIIRPELVVRESTVAGARPFGAE